MNNIKSKIRIQYKSDQTILLNPKKLEIKESTNQQAGLGVFASEFIPSGTIFLECIDVEKSNSDAINKKINDLAYKGTCNGYDTLENIEQNINIGYIVKYQEDWMSFFDDHIPKVYLYALNDINIDQELSRFYGLDYWLEYEFWQRFPNNKFKLTHKVEDLPNEWVFIDTIRSFLAQNIHKNLFALKKDHIDGKKIKDQYHYFVSYSNPKYFDPDFVNKLNDVTIITKKDYSPYSYDETYDHLYLTQYLKSIKENQMESQINYFDSKSDVDKNEQLQLEKSKENEINFWNKYPECNFKNNNNLNFYSHHKIPKIDDIPSVHVPVYILYKDGDKNLRKYRLYCKKIENKYYYLLDPNEYDYWNSYPTNYYDPQFKEEIPSFIDVTNDDFTKYQIDDCITYNEHTMHTIEHHENELTKKIKKKIQK